MTAQGRAGGGWGVTPYYDDGTVTIYHGDCREIVEDVEFDAIVTDPPYGSGYYETDLDVFASLMCETEVDRIDTPMAVLGYPETLVRWCVELRMVPDEWVTWWPSNGACRGVNYNGLRRESEAVAIFGTNRLYELRQVRTASSRRIIDANYRGEKQRGDSHGEADTRRLSDVWTMAAPGLAFQSHKRQHPNEKPTTLMSLLVQGFDGAILDPFMGSGSTLRAAKDLGRRAIGVEVEERYCEIAAKRMGQEVLEL